MNNITSYLENAKKQFDVFGIIDLSFWDTNAYASSQKKLSDMIAEYKKDYYEPNERIIFVHTMGDIYVDNSDIGLIFKNIQNEINEHDISNSFVIVVSNNPTIMDEFEYIKKISTDPVPITVVECDDNNVL